MIWLCRVLMLFVFTLFWGGLTFYTGFVVRVSHEVLNDPFEGGVITQKVTVLLQYLGIAAGLLMLINAAAVVRRSRGYGAALSVLASILILSVIGLCLVHSQLDAVIDIDAREILDREAFTISHRRYNQLTTIEWIACVLYLPVTLFAWRSIDRTSSSADEHPPGLQ